MQTTYDIVFHRTLQGHVDVTSFADRSSRDALFDFVKKESNTFSVHVIQPFVSYKFAKLTREMTSSCQTFVSLNEILIFHMLQFWEERRINFCNFVWREGKF